MNNILTNPVYSFGFGNKADFTPGRVASGVLWTRAKSIAGKSDGDAISQWNNLVAGATVSTLR